MKKLLVVAFLLSAIAAYAAPDSFAPLVKSTKDGVVHINTKQLVQSNPFMNDEMFRRFFGGQGAPHGMPGMPGGQYEAMATGTGFIIDKEGYIITNNHVVNNATEVIVKTSDDKEYTATLVGRDSLTDLALLKIDAKGISLKTLPLGDSDKIEVGEWVIAIGSAKALEWTVTAGIISAKGRNLGAGPYDNFIQTDASINPGNSGGPLLNMKGEVIGINTLIMQNSQGLGFSVPSNTLKGLLSQLKTGHVRRGWLGISLQDIDEKLAESCGRADSKGALVSEVIPNAPAIAAGVKSGDIVTEVDGIKVENSHQLVQYVGAKRPDETVKLTIMRDGKVRTINVKLAERTGGDSPVVSSVNPEKDDTFTVRNMSAAERAQMQLENGGAVIASVKPDSSAAKAGISSGMVATWMNRK
ncbi:MAG: trypsin-like peptidase domain-containing protein [Deferribacteraceae bacterium]|jgi:serine protease Do|nr:trypsin-like peptidase domain-containing protein [Deferribacteraceae bacterium]